MTLAPGREGRSLRVLALEPYYGGSHRAFLDGWRRSSRHAFAALTLPAYKWKWRMRQSALLFSREIERRRRCGERWDLVWASDMVGLSELLGLAREPLAGIPTVLYFHENQITYPVRFEKERDVHFGLSNIGSALAADEVWFNSAYHRESFLDAIPGFVRRLPDHRPDGIEGPIRRRSRVLAPGIDPPPRSPKTGGAASDVSAARSEAAERTDPAPTRAGPLRILWVARWEHDKAPGVFFEALDRLHAAGAAFEVSVLGESFREAPAVFNEARERLAERIVHWGYLDDRCAYEEALREGDVVVSTARHEFFGIAVLEAMAAGAMPLLPRRLSYPELLELADRPEREAFFYDGGAGPLAERLGDLCARKTLGRFTGRGTGVDAASRFCWSRAVAALDDAVENLVSAADPRDRRRVRVPSGDGPRPV